MPMWAIYLIVWIIAAVAVYFLMPTQTQKPPEVDDLDITPIADGKEIPVLFGTRDIDATQYVLWDGDRKTRPHKVSQGKK